MSKIIKWIGVSITRFYFISIIIVSLILIPIDLIRNIDVDDIIIEMHGLWFDLILFGIVLSIYEAFRSKRETKEKEDFERNMLIKKYKDDINDFRFWKSEEASHKVAGSIRRLNELGITKIVLTNSWLEKADLRDMNLSGAYLINANLRLSFISNTNFTDADLRQATFSKAYFHNPELTGAKVISKKWFQELIENNAAGVDEMMEVFEVDEMELIDDNAPWEELKKYYKIKKKLEK